MPNEPCTEKFVLRGLQIETAEESPGKTRPHAMLGPSGLRGTRVQKPTSINEVSKTKQAGRELHHRIHQSVILEYEHRVATKCSQEPAARQPAVRFDDILLREIRRENLRGLGFIQKQDFQSKLEYISVGRRLKHCLHIRAWRDHLSHRSTESYYPLRCV